ncbi:hypothetical protein B296_00013954 [Ensete ventricosum]|uniref:Uncharacterized protein n=1 Tax=Ensete ventricosum TaxID=4639 RepID=A0A427AHL7_ENSVE|nr:hypothetical protein B296_00013954 [Ensete ventricosum]
MWKHQQKVNVYILAASISSRSNIGIGSYDCPGNNKHHCWVHMLQEAFSAIWLQLDSRVDLFFGFLVSFCTKVDLNYLFIVKYNIICCLSVSFIIAFLLLLPGAALNDQRGKGTKYFGGDDCYVVKPGVFSGGAVLSLASVALGIMYYVALLSKTAQAWDPQQNEGIAMGHPRVPAQATPVFVHEDTYNRQQFP